MITGNELRIALLGDIALNGIISSLPELNAQRFSAISDLLNKQDLVFANLEMPLETGERNEQKSHVHFAGERASREVLNMLNVSCVSLANNHMYDCKMSGLKASIRLLEELNIQYTGAGWKEEQLAPVVLEKNDLKVGFMAYVDKGTNPNTESHPELYMNYLELEKIREDIKKIRHKVDILICSLHWGNDYSNFYTPEQQKIARSIVDSGADIIMGHHPHTIQPVENYRGKSIFYSLGGICFGDFYREGEMRAIKRKTKAGMVALMNREGKIHRVIPTLDLPGNTIIIPGKNMEKKLARLAAWNRLRNKYKLFAILTGLKEAFFDRLHEYFFGYYRHPLRQMFRIKNLRKTGYMFRDFKKASK